MNLDIKDNIFHPDDYDYLRDYARTAPYNYGEGDRTELLPTGVVHHVDINSSFAKNIDYQLKLSFKELKDLVFDRMYINCFAPREDAFYHIDAPEQEIKSRTCLIYLTDGAWIPVMGGETFFYHEDQVIGVPPHPNRAICFRSSLLHRASSFREGHRFTLAVKYHPIEYLSKQ